MAEHKLPRVPVPKLMLDGSDIQRDGDGRPWIAIQRDDLTKRKKYCQVYRMNDQGQWEWVQDVANMKGAPKIKLWYGPKDLRAIGVVFGHASDQEPIMVDIEGFVPIPVCRVEVQQS